jgi:hypothetical protein
MLGYIHTNLDKIEAHKMIVTKKFTNRFYFILHLFSPKKKNLLQPTWPNEIVNFGLL